MATTTSMFRPIARRGFSTFTSRTFLNQLRGRSRLNEELAQKSVYRVRLHQPPVFTWRNIGKKMIYFVPTVLVAYYFSPFELVYDNSEKQVFGPGDSPDPEEDVEEGEDEFDEEDDLGIFLPMTWPKLGPKEFYRGSDPEWQEYIKLSKNKDRQKRIFDELVMHIRQLCSDGSNITQALGTIDMSKGRHWLDVIFPPGPPRHYEQTGIEITTAYIAISRREISEHEYHQIRRWFNPTAVFKSVMATCVELIGLPAEKLKTLFENNDQAAKSDGNAILPSNGGRAGVPPGLIGFGPPNKGTPGNSGPNVGSPNQNDSQNRPGMSEHPEHGLEPASAKLMKTFLSTFNSRNSIDPPRGSIILSGLVECIGTRASTTVDVVACYDLFHDRFLLVSPKVRRLTEYRQRPRGR